MPKWKPTKQLSPYARVRRVVRIVSIGLVLLFVLSLLTSCRSGTIVIEPIKPDCINSIVTNQDMIECLARYDEA